MTEADLALAHYYFLPTVRDGMAAYISGAASGSRTSIAARLTPIADDQPQTITSKSVTLLGPGDVLGFSASAVTRTDPKRNVWNTEPNFLVCCEFGADPDFTHRFTADKFHDGHLTPWITLIVLETGNEFTKLGEQRPPAEQKKAIPIRWIDDALASALPDLSTAWMWAHSHVTATSTLASSDIPARLRDSQGVHYVSRLICSRRLKPGTKYTAFIVPTFKIGCAAAGLATMNSTESATTLAWDSSSPETVRLPYYYSWEFGTSKDRVDFEALVRALQPRPLTNLGKRPMDCSKIGYALPNCPSVVENQPEVIEIEGALMSPDLTPGQWAADGTTTSQAVSEFRDALAQLVNAPAVAPDSPPSATRPKVAPPLYGRWQSGRTAVTPNEPARWMDDVNLDPRLRAAAGYGALVVEQSQEELMASIYQQIGDMDMANEILRRGRLGLMSSKGLYGRLGAMSLPAFLWMTSPVFPRVRIQQDAGATPITIGHYLKGSTLPRAAFDPALRRLQRRGGIRKRQNAALVPPKGWDPLSRLNAGDIAAAGPPPKLSGVPSLCQITDKMVASLHSKSVAARSAQGAWRLLGLVVYRTTQHPVERVRVEAWDKDIFFSDLLGSAITDAQGRFVIEFDESYFRERVFDRKPDVFFKIFRGDHRLKIEHSVVLRDLAQGETSVKVEVETEGETPAAPGTDEARVYDFCEEAITPEAVIAVGNTPDFQNHRQAAGAIANALTTWLTPLPTPADTRTPANLSAIYAAVHAAVDPNITIPARIGRRMQTDARVHQRGVLAPLESEITLSAPLYEPLAEISQDLILPGIKTVPQDTISIVRTNRRFVETFVLSVNDSLSREILWRRAAPPVYLYSTYARQFWDVRSVIGPDDDPEMFRDITRIATWAVDSDLGSHDPRAAGSPERAVVLIRGHLLFRYPETNIFCVECQSTGDPALAEFLPSDVEETRIWPIFTGTLPPDLKFLGFDKTPVELCTGGTAARGYYVCIEERVGLCRMGFDVADDPENLPALTSDTWWNDLTWDHLQVGEGDYIGNAAPPGAASLTPRWGVSSATIANIALQRPFRMAIHASQLLSKAACEPASTG